MTKRLDLIFTDDDGRTQYEVGRDGVEALERVSGGYAVTIGAMRMTIHDHRVKRFVEIGRPGVATEPESGDCPYGQVTDGVWQCAECGATGTDKGKPFTTLHSLKIHYGKAHGQQ